MLPGGQVTLWIVVGTRSPPVSESARPFELRPENVVVETFVPWSEQTPHVVDW